MTWKGCYCVGGPLIIDIDIRLIKVRFQQHRKAEVESLYAREEYYRSERDYFRELALRHKSPFTTLTNMIGPGRPTKLETV